MFKLTQLLIKLVIAVKEIPFNLKLRYLNLRYGRGNIPADKLPKILSDDPEDRKAFFETMELCSLLQQILSHYRIEVQDSEVAHQISRYMLMESDSQEERTTVHQLIVRPDRAVALLRLIQQTDVTENKLAFFGPPSPFESMEAWVITLDANRYSLPAH